MSKIKWENNQYHLLCPGCRTNHYFGLGVVWNYDMNRPTIGSKKYGLNTVRAKSFKAGPDGKPVMVLCAAQVRNGQITFHLDSTHELAGKTVELEDWDTSSIKVRGEAAAAPEERVAEGVS